MILTTFNRITGLANGSVAQLAGLKILDRITQVDDVGAAAPPKSPLSQPERPATRNVAVSQTSPGQCQRSSRASWRSPSL